MEEITLSDTADQVVWRWTKDGCFSTALAYKAFFSGQHAIPSAKLLHKTKVPAKCKFFIWLVLHDRCWTATRTKGHDLQDDDRCVMCDQDSETITHLLIGCSYTKEVWHNLFCRWDIGKKKIGQRRKKGFQFSGRLSLLDHLAWTERKDL
jgi:hypothetical protein